MKTYEKPKLMALSLSGSDRLCGECSQNGAAYLLYQDPSGDIAQDLDWLIGNGDNVITKDELINLFGLEESCLKPVSIYCKFTGANTVAWS